MTLHTKFDKQYNLAYLARLNTLRSIICSNNMINNHKLTIKPIKECNSNKCIAIGVFFLCSALKPSILRRASEETRSASERTRLSTATYLSSCVKYFIEDETGRIEIQFKNTENIPDALITGMVLGFVGYSDECGIFNCTDIIFPNESSSTNGCPDLIKQTYTSKHSILFISNPAVNIDGLARLRLILDTICDRLSCLVLFGNLYSKNEPNEFKILNSWIESINMPVYIIPDRMDPTTRMLPQCPIPNSFFISSGSNKPKQLKNVFGLANPAQININGLDMALISNGIINELTKYLQQNKK